MKDNGLNFNWTPKVIDAEQTHLRPANLTDAELSRVSQYEQAGIQATKEPPRAQLVVITADPPRGNILPLIILGVIILSTLICTWGGR